MVFSLVRKLFFVEQTKLLMTACFSSLFFFSVVSLRCGLYVLSVGVFLGALNTKNKEIICVTLKIIQHMVTSSDLIGPGLVPFYRQLLPMFNAYKSFEGNNHITSHIYVN